MTQKEYFGFNSIQSLNPILAETSAKRIFLVTGKNSYITCGAKDCLCSLLTGYEVQRFWNFDSNPKAKDLERGIEVFNQDKYGVVIAVGGGSVIDLAKLINFSAVNNLDIGEHLSKPQKKFIKPRLLIAIPTTSGTGSEATHFAVLYIDHTKYSLAHEYILPDVAIVDPALTMSMPKYVTATTGMDALSQAIESYWSINSNDESKMLAAEAIELIMSNLPGAVNAPDTSARSAMSKAANLAGKAINITSTTASHAVSYPLTSYFGIPHGHAAALTLGVMLEYNAGVSDNDVLDSRGCDYVTENLNNLAALLGKKDISGAIEKITGLMKRTGLETKLSPLGVKTEKDIDTIINNGLSSDRAKNNPRKLTKDALRKMLYCIHQ